MKLPIAAACTALMSIASTAHADVIPCPPGSWTCVPAPAAPAPALPAPTRAPPLPPAPPAPPPGPPPGTFYVPEPAVISVQGGSSASPYATYGAPGRGLDADEGFVLAASALGSVNFTENTPSAIGGGGLGVRYRLQDVAIGFGFDGTLGESHGQTRSQADWSLGVQLYLWRHSEEWRPYVGAGIGLSQLEQDRANSTGDSLLYNLSRLQLGYEWRFAKSAALQFEARGQYLGASDRYVAAERSLPTSALQMFAVVGILLYPGH